MKAARLHEHKKPLAIDEVSVPAVKDGEVLVRIAAAGACHSDLHIMSGEIPCELPRTLGHENAGTVEETGPDVTGVQRGDTVAVFGAWGCGRCRVCRQGEEQLCGVSGWSGLGREGGFAEYLLVPAERHLIRLEGLDPVEVATLTDAGVTPYRAIKRALPHLYPGSAAVVLGVGGLGHLALQIFRAVSPSVEVIAVDVADDKLELASEMGADRVVDARGDAAAEIKKLTNREGARAVIDFVGTDATLKLAASIAARKGIIVLAGLAGGTLAYSFQRLRGECIVTNSWWGSYTELEELLMLARAGKVRASIQRFPLAEINEAFHLLASGRIRGRAVIIP